MQPPPQPAEPDERSQAIAEMYMLPVSQEPQQRPLRSLLVYSSQTGNTRIVAEVIYQTLPEPRQIYPVEQAPDPANYDYIILGFWVRQGLPDPTMLAYMEKVQGKQVAFFATLAAWPSSEHARQIVVRTRELLAGNLLLGSFRCQGRLAAELFAARMEGRSRHPMTPERHARLLEANQHPNAEDCNQARATFRQFLKAIS